jgi:hypothetical protein
LSIQFVDTSQVGRSDKYVQPRLLPQQLDQHLHEALQNDLHPEVAKFAVGFVVDSFGRVAYVEPIDLSEPERYASAIKAMRDKVLFQPGTMNGKAVSVCFVMPMFFTLSD